MDSKDFSLKKIFVFGPTFWELKQIVLNKKLFKTQKQNLGLTKLEFDTEDQVL